MSSVRWNSPFPYTLAFNLFKQHFEEINRAYWAFVPASNTIKALAKKSLIDDNADPKEYFMVPDEEDKHIAPSYGEWKHNYSEYINYSRLNIVMLLSSCFETYLRTVVSLAFESKPGVIIDCKDAVDGAGLLKRDITYGEIANNAYRFRDEITEICKGDWNSRFIAFQKYFGNLPPIIIGYTSDLDDFRTTRNNVGHFIGRKKSDYEAPIIFEPIETIRVSHNRILKYFKLIYSTAKQIDNYLKENYIGSYDIIKRYYIALSKGEIVRAEGTTGSYQLRKMLGSHDLKTVGKAYYDALIAYCETHYIESEFDCVFSKNRCVKEISRRLNEASITLKINGENAKFSSPIFKNLLKKDNLYTDPKYSRRIVDNTHQIQYLHSAALIDYMVKKIETNPDIRVSPLRKY